MSRSCLILNENNYFLIKVDKNCYKNKLTTQYKGLDN